MNAQDILEHEPKIFPDAKSWSAFHEMAGYRDQIRLELYKHGTIALQEHLKAQDYDGWSVAAWGNPNEDTVLYLNDFGVNSIAIRLGWQYNLLLAPWGNYCCDLEQGRQLIKDLPLLSKFEQLGGSSTTTPNALAMNSRRFEFAVNDKMQTIIDVSDLAWYAANRTDEFVKQVVNKLEVFITDPKATEQIYHINETLTSK